MVQSVFGIDASRAIAGERTGTETYALALTDALLRHAPNQSWRLYQRSGSQYFSQPNAEQRLLRPNRLWTHIALAWELARRPPAGIFIPAHVLPVLCRVPSVVTVHDLGYLHFPKAHTQQQVRYLDWSTRWASRHATHLLADSLATQRDLTTHYHTDPAKITVVYPGFDPKPFSAARTQPALSNLPARYLLHVGTIQPRKNLVRLLDAFAALPDPNLHLVLAGKNGWLAAEIWQHAKALGLNERLHWLAYVPDADLPRLYAHAQAFVFPSLFEGFGFPVLEAMAAGVPVVCSDGGALPEVVGDAALVVPAQDTAALQTALGRVLTQPNIRAALQQAGDIRCQLFTWERAAVQVYAVLCKFFEKHADGRLL
jgi:glycosyltransferase involved in cell wall biosynthesis